MKTLIVDDDKDITSLLSKVAKSIGLETTLCSSAEEAIELIKADEYPLILLDWLLPEMDGLALCRKLRSFPNGDKSVVIMITGHGKENDLQKVLDAGADDYIIKQSMNMNRLKIRLSIAIKRVHNRTKRKEAEVKLEATYRKVEKSYNDLCSVLNELQLGAMIIEKNDSVEFMNSYAETMFGISNAESTGIKWMKLLPFTEDSKNRISQIQGTRSELRKRFSFHFKNQRGRAFWTDFEIKQNPSDSKKKIFLFYDISDAHNLRTQLAEKSQFHGMIGKSKPMLVLRKQIEDFAKLNWTVLIEGETGTGKELIAKAMHFSSHRSEMPFIAVNTAGLNDSLLASQLFGHKRGSFTGAVEDNKGLFESARGGTLFLDEIGDISPQMQVSLLRVLEEGTIMRLGDNKERKVDVRLIAATNKNLGEEVSKRRFRKDLLYRLRAARINVPPLRGRLEDMQMLIEHFLAQSRAATGKNVQHINDDSMRILLKYYWPGNVRELKNTMDYAVVHSKGASIEPEDLPPEMTEPSAVGKVVMAAAPKTVGKTDIDEALKATGGNRTRAAKLLGISRATLYRHLSD